MIDPIIFCLMKVFYESFYNFFTVKFLMQIFFLSCPMNKLSNGIEIFGWASNSVRIKVVPDRGRPIIKKIGSLDI